MKRTRIFATVAVAAGSVLATLGVITQQRQALEQEYFIQQGKCSNENSFRFAISILGKDQIVPTLSIQRTSVAPAFNYQGISDSTGLALS